MTQVWSEDDRLLPVTVIEAGPCVVTQVKTRSATVRAVQIGFGFIKEAKVNKPMAGHFAKAKVEAKKYLAEIRLGADDNMKLGQTIGVDVFEGAKQVHVSGVSKGKGFAGVMKRYNFKGGPGGHGSHFHRALVPSVSGATRPVFKGSSSLVIWLRDGHVKNLDIVKIDVEQNLLLVKGAVPAPRARC